MVLFTVTSCPVSWHNQDFLFDGLHLVVRACCVWYLTMCGHVSGCEPDTVEPLYYSPPNYRHLHYTDGWLESRTVGHRNVYLLDLRINDTSLFRITDVCSAPNGYLPYLLNSIQRTEGHAPHRCSIHVPCQSYRWLCWHICRDNDKSLLQTHMTHTILQFRKCRLIYETCKNLATTKISSYMCEERWIMCVL